MSSTQPDDEGHHAGFQEIFKDCGLFAGKLFLLLTTWIVKSEWCANYLMKVMTIVSSITTYFSHSNYTTHHLKEELKKEKDQCGIQVAGVTRFSLFSIHAKSISWCLYPIQRCLTSGTVKFDMAAVSFLLIYLLEIADVVNRDLDLDLLDQGSS